MLLAIGSVGRVRTLACVFRVLPATRKSGESGTQHESVPNVASRWCFAQLFAHVSCLFTNLAEYDTLESQLLAHESHLLAH